MRLAQKSIVGTLLFIYGIMGSLFQTFIGYWTYLNMNEQMMYLLIVILNPLVLIIPLSTLNILIIGMYPFAFMICGFFLVISQKRRNRKRKF